MLMGAFCLGSSCFRPAASRMCSHIITPRHMFCCLSGDFVSCKVDLVMQAWIFSECGRRLLMRLNHAIHTAQDCCGLVGRFEGQDELAPILCQACVLSFDGIREQDSVLLAAGVSKHQFQLLTQQQAQETAEAVSAPARRADLPLVAARKRAGFQASIDAAAPENRAASMRRLQEDCFDAIRLGANEQSHWDVV